MTIEKKIRALYVDEHGELQAEPELLAVGLNGVQVELADQTWIDLPSSGEITLLPGRLPLGYDESSAEVVALDGVTAVAAMIPVGYTRTLLPGYEKIEEIELPLLGYTAIGSCDGKLKVAALATDGNLKWNPVYYNTLDLPRLIQEKQREHPKNRILSQLAKCALEYHCLTAQNIFYQRWEAGIPVSPVCNAQCLGCISLQPSECCPAPQGRINFIPTVDEIVELAVVHLEHGAEPIVSFGQGCEGEPSLQSDLLVKSITEIRRQTNKGTLNINSNAGDFAAIKQLVDHGLDSIRVSLFSAVAENYHWYHRPIGYDLAQVIASLKYASQNQELTSINLLLYPGFTNSSQETLALKELIATTDVKLIQLRNLNLDPEKMLEKLTNSEVPPLDEWLTELQHDFPRLQFGNYSKPLR